MHEGKSLPRMADIYDEAFGAFDDERPPVLTTARPAAAAAAAPSKSEPTSTFEHLREEHLATVNYGHLGDEDRARLEELMRECTATTAQGAVSELTRPLTDESGTVHFFQAFVADFAGSSSAQAAYSAPRPHYNRLVDEPLPLQRKSQANGRGAGGRGAGGNGRRGGPRATDAFSGRYFDAPSAVRPGAISNELRALLGMREGDPPPYLARMRQLGYPPGYLGNPDQADEEEPALQLFDEPPASTSASARAGPLAPPPGAPLVDFEGLNVPPPSGSNEREWGWSGPITRAAGAMEYR